MFPKLKREKKIPEIKGILKHYRITHVLRDPNAPLPAGRSPHELVFHVRFINGSKGKPIKSDEYLTYDVVVGTRAFQEYANHYLTPRIGRAIGKYPGTNEEVVSFVEGEAVRKKHEEYMNSVFADLTRKRKSHTTSMNFEPGHRESVKKFRHCTSDDDCALSIKSEPVIKELNERFAAGKEDTEPSETSSVNSRWFGSQTSKSSLITTTSVFTLRSVFEPPKLDSDTENNNPAVVVKKEKRPAPPPPLIEKDESPPLLAEKNESFSSFASASSGSVNFNDSFAADGPPFGGHRPSDSSKKRDSLCCVM